MANDNIIEKLDIEAPVMANAQEAIRELRELVELAEQHTERYDLSWVGKARAFAEAGMPINKTLRPDLEESVNFNETENLFITGDNLDALKLLQESYLGKVDMIYIDPPYNTGKDFVYHDKFSKTFEEAKEASKDDEGYRLYTVNSSDSGRYHSDWLSMMYPRLRIARNLLNDRGVIFISIDDNEIENLKRICEIVFGEGNFVGQWNWFKSATPPNLSKKIKKNIEYILCYQRGNNNDCFKGIQKTSSSDDPMTKPQNSIKALIFPPNSLIVKLKDGIYKAGLYGTERFPNELLSDLVVKNGTNQNEAIFKNKFVWLQSKLNDELRNNTRISLSSNLVLSFKKAEYGEEVPPNLIDETVGVDTTENAGKYVTRLFEGKQVFDYPKPISLLKYLINMVCEKSALILDFFAGSGTTAHAVMKLNAEDGGKRKWILVQLDEATAENSEAHKAGYLTIDAIARERIRRAEKSLYTDTSTSLSASSEKNKRDSQDLFADENLGNPGNLGKIPVENPGQIKVGFRALRVDTNNINDGILKSPAETKQDDLFLAVDNIKRERTPLDLLFGTLTSFAFELNKQLRITNYELRNGTVQTLYVYDYFGELSGLVACFDDVVSEEAVKEIARMRPLAAVFRDSSFATAAEKVNLSEHFRTLSPETKVKVI